jgi:hypothetical protein
VSFPIRGYVSFKQGQHCRGCLVDLDVTSSLDQCFMVQSRLETCNGGDYVVCVRGSRGCNKSYYLRFAPPKHCATHFCGSVAGRSSVVMVEFLITISIVSRNENTEIMHRGAPILQVSGSAKLSCL